MVFAVSVMVLALAQQQPVPQPFPRPGQRPASPAPSEPAPQRPAPSQPAPAQPAPSQPTPSQPANSPQQQTAPGAETLGLQIYPGAVFLSSYDAGAGQRYYLFGTNASFAEIVAYYKTFLRDKGELVFDEPPTQIFEVGRFREETMVYPPGITVKDYTWNGSPGYLHIKAGAAPQRFKTIIQIVPVPPVPAR